MKKKLAEPRVISDAFSPEGHVSRTQPSPEKNEVKAEKHFFRFGLHAKDESWHVFCRIVSDNSPNICLLDLLGSALNSQPQAVTTPLTYVSEKTTFHFIEFH